MYVLTNWVTFCIVKKMSHFKLKFSTVTIFTMPNWHYQSSIRNLTMYNYNLLCCNVHLHLLTFDIYFFLQTKMNSWLRNTSLHFTQLSQVEST